MKPLLKSLRNVDWHVATTDDSSTSDFLTKLSAFLEEHDVKRTRTKPKCLNKKQRARLRANKKKVEEKIDASVSEKKMDDIDTKEELKKKVLKKDVPVCVVGLRSVLRALDKSDQLAMAVVDANALMPSAVGHFIGLFAASCKIPIYAVRGLNEQLAERLNLNSLHAIGFLKVVECESIVSTTAELLKPVSVTDADSNADSQSGNHSNPRKRKFTPANVVTPVASSTKKRKRRKGKSGAFE